MIRYQTQSPPLGTAPVEEVEWVPLGGWHALATTTTPGYTE